jgi:hypothetical protein
LEHAHRQRVDTDRPTTTPFVVPTIRLPSITTPIQ